MTNDVITALGPDIALIDNGHGQAYLLRTAGGGPNAVLVDTGELGHGRFVSEALRRWGLDERALKTVLLTHWHPDHCGSAAEIGEWPDVQVWAHRGDADVIRGREAGPPPALTEAEIIPHSYVEGVSAPAARVDRELAGDGPVDGLPAGIEARLIETPGHTAGSVGFVFPQHRTFITGDVVANQGGQIVFGPFNVDGAQALASFRRLSREFVDPDGRLALVCFGHGAPVSDTAVESIFEATASSNPVAYRFDR